MEWLVTIHSVWRWAVLIAAIGALALAIASYLGSREWDGLSDRSTLIFVRNESNKKQNKCVCANRLTAFSFTAGEMLRCAAHHLTPHAIALEVPALWRADFFIAPKVWILKNAQGFGV